MSGSSSQVKVDWVRHSRHTGPRGTEVTSSWAFPIVCDAVFWGNKCLRTTFLFCPLEQYLLMGMWEENPLNLCERDLSSTSLGKLLFHCTEDKFVIVCVQFVLFKDSSVGSKSSGLFIFSSAFHILKSFYWQTLFSQNQLIFIH